jgi:hypothetical protein
MKKYQIPVYRVENGLKETGQFVNLPFLSKEQEGVTVEAVIEAVANVLMDKYLLIQSPQTKGAIEHLSAALQALQNREADRAQRGVLGTNQA